MPPLPLPPHEQRERWMTAISASFHRMTLWRYLRTRLLQLEQLKLIIDVGIHKAQSILSDFWLGTRAVAILRRCLRWADRFRELTEEMMNWLNGKKWRNPADEQLRTEKETVIKIMVVLGAMMPLIKTFGVDTCDALTKVFSHHGPVQNLRKRNRRWSQGDEDQYLSELLINRCYYERTLSIYLQRQESGLRNNLRDIRLSYNNSHLFERLVKDVHQENAEEENLWRLARRKFPYPKYQLKDTSDVDSERWRANAPLDGVLPWEEDGELQSLLE